MEKNIRLILLRVFLLYGALGWGVCLVGVVVPGAVAFDLLGYIGGVEPHALFSDWILREFFLLPRGRDGGL